MASLTVKKLRSLNSPVKVLRYIIKATETLSDSMKVNLASYAHLYNKLSAVTYLYKDTLSTLSLFEQKMTESTSETQSSSLSGKALHTQLGKAIESLDTRHGMIIDTLADALLSYKAEEGPEDDTIKAIVKQQMIISLSLQHAVALTSVKNHLYSKTGCIKAVDLPALCEMARENTNALVMHEHINYPSIVISTDEASLAFVKKYEGIPSVLYFVLLELMKNAAHATIINNKQQQQEDLQDIDVKISYCEDINRAKKGKKKPVLLIEIVDQGIGMTKDQIKESKAFFKGKLRSANYLVDEQKSYQPVSSPLQGLGVGLTLSHLYLQVLHCGTLTHESKKGKKGTKATLQLNIT